MLKKLKQIWTEFRIAIIVAALFAVYFFGKNKGVENEKARQNSAVLANISRADYARSRLRDTGVLRRLRKKYGRKKITRATTDWDNNALGIKPGTTRSRWSTKPGNSGIAYRLKRDVWILSTQPSMEKHYAMFPEKLIMPCVLCGCPENGIVLDPFIGSGTTALVAAKLGRRFIGIELNPDYHALAQRRITPELNTIFNYAQNG
jgi:DNA modification methylase